MPFLSPEQREQMRARRRLARARRRRARRVHETGEYRDQIREYVSVSVPQIPDWFSQALREQLLRPSPLYEMLTSETHYWPWATKEVPLNIDKVGVQTCTSPLVPAKTRHWHYEWPKF